MKGLHQGLSDRPHFVYRAYDADDRLLYVGCTVNVHRRFQQHRSKGSVWFPEMVRWTVEEHRNYLWGRSAEELAIRSERPLHNKALTTPRPKVDYEKLRAMLVQQCRNMRVTPADFEARS